VAKIPEEELIAHADNQFRHAVNWRSERIEKEWVESNDQYNGKFSPKERTQSEVLKLPRLFINKTFTHLRKIHIDVMATFFNDPEEIVNITSSKKRPLVPPATPPAQTGALHTGAVHTGIPTVTEIKETVKTLLNYRLNGHPINFYQEMYEATLDALKNKIGILKVYPQVTTQKAKITNSAGEIKEIEVVEDYTPHIDCIPYEDVYFSPQATWKDYWRFTVIHRMIKSLDYLKRRGYTNLDKLDPFIVAGSTTDTVKESRSGDDQSPVVEEVDIASKSKLVYVYEIWTFLDVNGDGLLESCKYTMGGDAEGPKEIISKLEENTLPYETNGEIYNRSPFIMGVAYPEAHELAGKDFPHIIQDLQKETNAIRNQRREAVALSIRKSLLVARSSGMDLVSLINRRAGSLHLGDNITETAVRELATSPPDSSSIYEQNRTDQDIAEVGSVTPVALGMPSSPDTTATAINREDKNSSVNTQAIILCFAYTLVLPALRLLLRLEQAYISDEEIEAITGRILGWEKGQDNIPSSDHIEGEFDLTVNVGMNKQSQLTKFLLIMDRAMIANQASVQFLTAGIASPMDVKLINPMKLFAQLMTVMGEKAIEDYEIQTQAPPPLPIGGGKGIASQPTQAITSPEIGGDNINV